jgi:hypothetical protein
VSSNDCETQIDWSLTNGIRVDPRDFTDACESVNTDTIAYESDT